MIASWTKLRELYRQASELAPGPRATFVERVEQESGELGRELRGLLEFVEPDESFLQPPAGPELTHLFADAGEPVHAAVPARVGPYALERELGSGGMGSVYLGTRTDGGSDRRAAVKVLRGVATEELRTRFRAERQLLATLRHPNIAALIDGGDTEEGWPWIAMELVDGDPIDVYVERHDLSVSDRLRLFRKVCDAVQHAHAALVIHRDLKPSNVLVDERGEPRLLDFGIAKVLAAGEGRPDPLQTRAGQQRLTPAYASPEQVRGEPVTTSSDVYSLGVLLHRVLTGRSPYGEDGESALGVLRAICDEEPVPPSEAATDPMVARELRGELDAIVARSLRKQPGDRYASAAELSADLERFLRGFPVLARPDSPAYRARKFVRRNRVAVLFSAATTALLIAGAVFAFAQTARAERARHAEQELREAALARTAEAAQLNEQVEQQRALAESRYADARRFASQLIWDLHRRVSGATRPAEAAALAVESGVQYLDRLASEAQDDPEMLRELVSGYLDAATFQGGVTQETRGDDDAALERLDRAGELVERLLAIDADNPETTQLFLRTNLQRGTHALGLGDFDAGREHLLRGVEAVRACAAPGSRLLWESAVALEMTGLALTQEGRPSDGLPYYEEGLEALDRAVELAPANEMFVRGTRAHLLFGFSANRSEARDFERAAELGERAVELYGSITEAHRPTEQLLRAQAGAWSMLARAYLGLERPDDAERAIAASRAAIDTLIVTSPENVAALHALAGLHGRSAEVALLRGDLGAVLRCREEGLGVARDLTRLDPDNANAARSLVDALGRLAEAQLAVRRPEAAVPAAREAAVLADELAEASPEEAVFLREARAASIVHGRVLEASGQAAEAEAAFARGRALHARVLEEEEPNAVDLDAEVELSRMRPAPKSVEEPP